MVTLPRAILLCVVGATLLGLTAAAPSGSPGRQGPATTTPIEHLVIIQIENWSFDSLFGFFPGADGFAGAGTPTPFPQTDKLGNPLASVPGPNPTCGPAVPVPTQSRGTPATTATPPGCFPVTMQPTSYDLSAYIDRTRHPPPDTIHEFFREQLQIDGGRMDRFAAYNDTSSCPESCPGAVMGYWDLNAIPTTTPSIAHYARQYTLADKFHHGMFGA